MIEVKFCKRGICSSKDLLDLNLNEENLVVDCTNPYREELRSISKVFNISLSQLETALDPRERPTIDNYETYTRITISSPIGIINISKTISISFFISDKFIIILKKKHISAFDKMKAIPLKDFDDLFSKNISQIFHFYLSHVLNDYFEVLDHLEDDINKIETKLFKNFDDKTTIKKIFEVRKTLIYFHKSLIANREVFLQIDKETVRQIKKADIRKYRNLYFDVNQLIDMVGTYREILTGSMDIYMTAVSNNLNEVMKRLTVYASYVMVPTFISGVYGMNFRFMPEIGWEYGYFFALFLMVFSVLTIRHSFKKKGWI